MKMSRRWKLANLLPLVFAIAIVSIPWWPMTAQQAPENPYGAQPQPQGRVETNGAPGGTPILQNPNINRPLTNDGMSSNPVRYLQQQLRCYRHGQ